MAVKGQSEVAVVNAASVVFHGQSVKPSALNRDDNGGRTCIEAVFHQFFDHLGGSFNHLPCGDEPDGGVIQLPDFLRFHAPPSMSFLSA